MVLQLTVVDIIIANVITIFLLPEAKTFEAFDQDIISSPLTLVQIINDQGWVSEYSRLG